jgi:hypothetical protein
MTLKTRKPTGRAGWPKMLVEGSDKAGKSWSLAKLSASPKVGRTAVLVLGEDESRWNEYGKIPGVRFELVEHDGTWVSIMEAVQEAKAEAAAARDAGELPFVFGIDTMTAEWDGLKDWATHRARNSKKNRALLAQDPDAEIDVTINYWNDARGRHRALMRHLLTFPGIVVLIARGGEVAQVRNGQPVIGQKTWSVEGERNLPFDVSVHVRLSRDSRPLLVSASGVHCQIRPGIDPPRRLPDDWSLESVIFDTLKLDAATAEVREFPEFRQELTPEQVRDEALKPETGFERIRELYAFTDRSFPAVEVDGELLLPLLKHIGDERRRAASPQRDAAPAEAVRDEPPGAPPAPEPSPDEKWFAAAMEAAPKHASLEACTVTWHKSAEMVRDGTLAKADAAKLQDILRKRMEELKAEPKIAAPVAAVLDPDDPWALKVEGLGSQEEADDALVEASVMLGSGEMDGEHFARIEAAVLARFPQTDLVREEAAA